MVDPNNIALVGSETLLGREVRDIVATMAPDLHLRLIADVAEEPGKLTRVGDEPALVTGLNAESLAGGRAVILAGSPESSRSALELRRGPARHGHHRPHLPGRGAPRRAPARALRGGRREPEEARRVHVIAHPAAIALALFLRRLHANDAIRRSVVHIFAPASEYGARRVEELQQQTVTLLSFKSLPKAIFDAQLSFNMLARYGEEAPVRLEDSELRIERHLATLLDTPGEGEGAPMPSLRLIQAPVFHGYSFSAWVEFEDNPGLEALESGLAMESIEVRGEDIEPPTNVGQAGQGGIAVGAIIPDRNDADAYWFWLVADNLRLAAENAVAVARQLV